MQARALREAVQHHQSVFQQLRQNTVQTQSRVTSLVKEVFDDFAKFFTVNTTIEATVAKANQQIQKKSDAYTAARDVVHALYYANPAVLDGVYGIKRSPNEYPFAFIGDPDRDPFPPSPPTPPSLPPSPPLLPITHTRRLAIVATTVAIVPTAAAAAPVVGGNSVVRDEAWNGAALRVCLPRRHDIDRLDELIDYTVTKYTGGAGQVLYCELKRISDAIVLDFPLLIVPLGSTNAGLHHAGVETRQPGGTAYQTVWESSSVTSEICRDLPYAPTVFGEGPNTKLHRVQLCSQLSFGDSPAFMTSDTIIKADLRVWVALVPSQSPTDTARDASASKKISLGDGPERCSTERQPPCQDFAGHLVVHRVQLTYDIEQPPAEERLTGTSFPTPGVQLPGVDINTNCMRARLALHIGGEVDLGSDFGLLRFKGGISAAFGQREASDDDTVIGDYRDYSFYAIGVGESEKYFGRMLVSGSNAVASQTRPCAVFRALFQAHGPIDLGLGGGLALVGVPLPRTPELPMPPFTRRDMAGVVGMPGPSLLVQLNAYCERRNFAYLPFQAGQIRDYALNVTVDFGFQLFGYSVVVRAKVTKYAMPDAQWTVEGFFIDSSSRCLATTSLFIAVRSWNATEATVGLSASYTLESGMLVVVPLLTPRDELCRDECIVFGTDDLTRNGQCDDGGESSDNIEEIRRNRQIHMDALGLQGNYYQLTQYERLQVDHLTGLSSSLCRYGFDCTDCGTRYTTDTAAADSGAPFTAADEPKNAIPRYEPSGGNSKAELQAVAASRDRPL